MKFVDVDGSRYQVVRHIVNVSVGWFMLEIGVRSCIDSDWLVIEMGSWKITRDLVFRDGSGGRDME